MSVLLVDDSSPLYLMSDWVRVIGPAHFDDDDPAGRISIDAEFDQELGRVVATSVEVSRAAPGQEVTSRDLREVAVATIVSKFALESMIEVSTDPEEGFYIEADTWLARLEPPRGRDRDHVLRDAALAYVIASAAGAPPLQTTATALGVSQSTATRYIKLAREASHFGDWSE